MSVQQDNGIADVERPARQGWPVLEVGIPYPPIKPMPVFLIGGRWPLVDFSGDRMRLSEAPWSLLCDEFTTQVYAIDAARASPSPIGCEYFVSQTEFAQKLHQSMAVVGRGFV